jgi:hypothetical protein
VRGLIPEDEPIYYAPETDEEEYKDEENWDDVYNKEYVCISVYLLPFSVLSNL